MRAERTSGLPFAAVPTVGQPALASEVGTAGPAQLQPATCRQAPPPLTCMDHTPEEVSEATIPMGSGDAGWSDYSTPLQRQLVQLQQKLVGVQALYMQPAADKPLGLEQDGRHEGPQERQKAVLEVEGPQNETSWRKPTLGEEDEERDQEWGQEEQQELWVDMVSPNAMGGAQWPRSTPPEQWEAGDEQSAAVWHSFLGEGDTLEDLDEDSQNEEQGLPMDAEHDRQKFKRSGSVLRRSDSGADWVWFGA